MCDYPCMLMGLTNCFLGGLWQSSSIQPIVASADPAELMQVARTHKLLPLAIDALLVAEVALDNDISQAIRVWRTTFNLKRAIYASECLEIQTALDAIGIRTALRKGLSYDELFYGGRGLRTFGDLDFFAIPSQASAISDYMATRGYYHGNLDPTGSRVVAWGRREVLQHTLYPDHIPRLNRDYSNEYVRWVAVDFSLDIAWHGAPIPDTRLKIVTDAVEEDNLLKSGVRTLENSLHFIDSCLHLFRDAYFEKFVERGIDVQLGKFLDCALIWRSLVDEQRQLVASVLRSHDLSGPVAWVCYHLDAIYELDTFTRLGIDDGLTDFPPDSWQKRSGELGRWSGTMVDRLFSKDRSSLFA